MPWSALQLARVGVQQWNAGDFDAFFALWHPRLLVRPDVNFPDAGELTGADARQFVEDQRRFMGNGRLEILEEHDLGERSLLRVRQHVEATASGVQGAYDWSFLTTAREGRAVRIEFFIDSAEALRAAGADDASH